MKLKEFIWTEPAPPNSGVTSFYDHVIAVTVLGEFKIEWKSWKQWDSYCLYFDGNYLNSLDTLEDAKNFAYNWLNEKFQEMLESEQ